MKSPRFWWLLAAVGWIASAGLLFAAGSSVGLVPLAFAAAAIVAAMLDGGAP